MKLLDAKNIGVGGSAIQILDVKYVPLGGCAHLLGAYHVLTHWV